MRSVVLLLALCALGLIGAAIYSATQERTLAFTLGVPSNSAVAPLRPGQQLCQQPVAVPDADSAFDAVAVQLGTYGRPGPALELTIRSGARTLAVGHLPGGYGDDASPSIPVGHVGDRAPLRVCVRNAGQDRVALYGAADAAARNSSAAVDGKPLNADVNLVFERAHPRSVASLAPAILSRASLFRVSWLGAWTYVLLALLVLAGIPALLALALRNAQTGK
jgi:hypothetical protein